MLSKERKGQLEFSVSLANKLGQPAFLLDSEYNVLEINRRAAKLHQKTTSQIKNKNYIHDICIDKDFLKSLSKVLLKDIKKKTQVSLSSTLNEVYFEWAILRFGEIPSDWVYLVIGTDKTHERKHSKELKLIRAIVKRNLGYTPKLIDSPSAYAEIIISFFQKLILILPGFVYWKDRNCNYLGCNQNVLNLVGLDSQEEMIGKTDYDLAKAIGWSKDIPKKFIKDDKFVMKSNQPLLDNEEDPFKTVNDRFITQLTNRVPMNDANGNVIGVLCNTFDITERKEMEEGLRQAKEKAEAASRAKSSFIASMSHDLRTPLIGVSEMIRQIREKIADPTIKQQLSYALESSQQLLKFFNEILDVAKERKQRKKPKSARFSMRGLVKDVAGVLVATSHQKQIPLEIIYPQEIPDCFVGCRSYIHRILFNLATNAFKFTQEGKVTIRIQITQRKGQLVTLGMFVEDTGIGIPQDKHEYVFEDFNKIKPSYQSQADKDKNAMAYQGAGLGLSIVREFLEDIDGQIELESEEAKGSKFKCFIPLRVALSESDLDDIEEKHDKAYVEKPQKEEEPLRVPRYDTPPQLLLIEDDFLCQRIFAHTIEEMRYPLDITSTASEGVALLRTNPEKYDIIFSDMGLPDMEGLDLIKAVRSDLKITIPMIAVSAHIAEEEQAKYFRAGISDIFIKPATQDDLIKTVKKYYDGTILDDD